MIGGRIEASSIDTTTNNSAHPNVPEKLKSMLMGVIPGDNQGSKPLTGESPTKKSDKAVPQLNIIVNQAPLKSGTAG